MPLADEDTNSILTYNVIRAIQGNVARQVAPPADVQMLNQYKWRHLVTKFGSNASGATWKLHFVTCRNYSKYMLIEENFVTCPSGSFWWPNFKISNKFQDFNQISGFQPNFKISTSFCDFDPISGFQANFGILEKF